MGTIAAVTRLPSGRLRHGGAFAPPANEFDGGHPDDVVGRQPHDALLAFDVETVVDTDLLLSDKDADRFAKPAWHRIVTISFIEVGIHRDDRGPGEAYRIRACHSDAEPGWDEARLLEFLRGEALPGRHLERPVVRRAAILMRSMYHGIATPAWFRRGTRWAG